MTEEELMEKEDHEITAEIKKIRQTLEEFQNKPFDKELMTIYIHHKTKISMKNIKTILQLQEEFIHKLTAKRL